MYKLLPIIAFTVIYTLFNSLQGQTTKPFNYRISDSITFLNSGNAAIKNPVSGGFHSPQFSSCDVNGDLKKDLVVYDRIDGSITTFINKGGAGEVKYENDNRYAAYFPKIEANRWFLMRDFNNDGFEDIFTSNGIVYKNISYTVSGKPAFERLPLLLYRNLSPDGSFIEYNQLSLPFIHVPGIYDIDFDGDLDIVSYSNLGGAIEMYMNHQVEYGLPPDSMRFMLVDLRWGDFYDKDCNTFLLNQGDTAGKRGPSKFYGKRHTNGSSIVLFDADNDKDIDMVLGNEGCDHMTILYNGKKNYNSRYDTIISYDTNFVTTLNRARVWLYPAGYFLDVDNDGKRDFIMSPNSNTYAIQETNQVFWFKNNGADLAPVFSQKQLLFTDQVMDIGNKSSWACADLDKDGDVDCLCANNADSSYNNGLMDRIYLFENTGTSKNPVFKLRDKNFGGFLSQNINSLTIALSDMNADGKLDLVTGNDRGEIKFYKNTSATNTTLSPTFVLSNNAFPGFNIDAGYYSYPAVADINNDGLKDLVVGHADTFLKYYVNIGTATVPDFNFVTAFFGQASPKDSFNFDYIHDIEWDTNGNVIKDSIVGIRVFYEKTIYSTPQIADINGDGILELLVGNTVGHLKLYKINSADVTGKFDQYPDFYYYKLLQNQKITSFDLGNRISPVFANLTDDEVPEIIVAINRGGINYFKPDFKYKTSVSDIHIAELVSIYPNPAHNFTIVDMGYDEVKSVRLITITGQVYMPVYSQKDARVLINTADLTTGIYYLNIETYSGKVKVAKMEILR